MGDVEELHAYTGEQVQHFEGRAIPPAFAEGIVLLYVRWVTAYDSSYRVIIRVLHQIAALPWVYNLIQKAVGREKGYSRMRPYLAQTAGCTVLEVGAGTGDWAEVLPPTARYLWFDNDSQKLSGFLARGTGALAVIGDAARMCLKDKSVGWALCVAVSHHLTDDELRQFLRSLAKVSRNGLIFLDGLRSEGRWTSQVLWKYDRGANPRRLENLRPFIEEFFDIEKEEQFAIYHNYWICQARPKA